MTDELAARRPLELPEWAKTLAAIRLGVSFGIGVMPHAKWTEENPGVPEIQCPEHLLEVSIIAMGAEIHPPSALDPRAEPDPAKWPRVQFPIGEFMRIPWLKWRAMAQSAFAEGRPAPDLEVPE